MNDTVDISDVVFAIKNDPDIDEYIVKWGIINSKNQKFEIQNNNNIYVWLIKNSTSIEWGFSGWPLINLNWEVIWINTAIDNIEYSASYALPISQEFINQTLASIKESWQIIRPYLWIEYSDSDFLVKITNIIEWSPASKTELSVWDIIVWINNIPITYNNFMYNLYTYKVWKQITLNILASDHKKDIQITIWKE
jgi:S1-C subfamily serine protease